MTSIDTQLEPPRFSHSEVAGILRGRYQIAGQLRELPSERDQNFEVTASDGEQFVLKISAAAEDPAFLACQMAVLGRLAATVPSYTFPITIPDRDGNPVSEELDHSGTMHRVRLLRYVPGEPLGIVRRHSRTLLEDVGSLMGQVARALEGFEHPAAHRAFRWDLRRGPEVIAQCQGTLLDREQRHRIESFLGMVQRELAPVEPLLRTSVIHNDANDFNVLVAPADPRDPGSPRRVSGLVDFGDVIHSYTVGEAAVAAAYAMLRKRDPLGAACAVAHGFFAALPLRDAELTAFFPLTCLRLCMSAVLSAYQRAQQPGNAYLSVSETAVWDLLGRLESTHPDLAQYRIRAACGLPPCPGTAAVVNWLTQHAGDVGPVLDPDPRVVSRTTLDLSVGTAEWGSLIAGHDPGAWSHAVFERLRADTAAVGIGRYDEARRWYTTPQFRAVAEDGDEWRTIHIGVDLFAAAGTPVLAPLDGIVESVQDNAAPLDYGPTVILRHDIGDGRAFYTLFGHLDRSALDLRAGVGLRRGDRLAGVGSPPGNGGWAPHLHLQLITDLVGHEGNFPGVATARDRDLWLALSPDPNLLLQLPEGCRTPRGPRSPELAAGRRERLGPSLSVAYRTPLAIVGGWMQHLYDVDGRAYLDVVNNVAHVGHCHPHVVDSLRRQSAVLNTNTRYLHPTILEYAERLAHHLPPSLSVCYFVCSGSEANELALRLARTYTTRRDVIVVDHAYHGNTAALVEVSPYKFNGPGGRGPTPHVHAVTMPDPYRGVHRGYGIDAGRRYAEDVARAVADVRAAGREVAAFLSEAIVSGGGQVEPPAGYLSRAYEIVREAGGLCIADEVQIGFGRVGTHFWGFEAQGVVPDIVTMGKPIGNGHPLGAVVTTPEIARAFANGMEYFNTFGGNPVSCAVGLAVLDVIEQEGLQGRAVRVGAHLVRGLQQLAERHPVIGDVRGRGLFLGIELVRDRSILEPLPRHATYVVERMKERGILLSTEGPFGTVIKMKPPLVFSECDADRLVDELDEVLGELPPLA